MSLFEKLNNKRYNLQEGIDSKGNITPNPGDKAKEKSILRNYNKQQKNLSKDISQRVTAQDRQQQLYNRQYDAYDDGDLGNPSQSKTTVRKKVTASSGAKVEFPSGSAEMGGESKKFASRNRTPSPVVTATSGGKTKSLKPKITGDVITNKGVKQSEVSKQAKEFTKKVNKQNKNLNPPTRANYPKTRKELIAKRKEYGIDRKGNISDAGVKRYAQKTKQLSSGSNVPAKVTAKDLKVAKLRAVGGEKIKDSTGKVVGTTTGKYGGRLPNVRGKNQPSLADVKAKIDAKNPTFTSPITGGKLPVKQVRDPDLKRMSPADRLKYKEIVKKYKTPKSVLKVTEPGSKFKKSKFKGFDEVPTSDPVGQEILKKMDRTVNVPPKPPLKKPNVFQKLSKKLFDPEGWKIPKKDYDLKPLRIDKATGFPLAQTRRSFKRVLKIPGTGALRKGFAMLPNRYKLLGGLALTTYALTRPKDSDTAAAKAGKITYKKVEKPLGFDTGRKVNQDRINYNQFLKKNNMTDPQQKTLLAKQKERSDNAAARARRNSAKPAQYGSTFTYKDKKTGELKTGSKLTTKKPKNINKNLP